MSVYLLAPFKVVSALCNRHFIQVKVQFAGNPLKTVNKAALCVLVTQAFR
ncbi:hypothetical protein [Alkalimarinus coralli]